MQRLGISYSVILLADRQFAQRGKRQDDDVVDDNNLYITCMGIQLSFKNHFL